MPAGVYGDFTANSGSSFTLGVAGATTAAVYVFQRLTLNSNSQLNVVGPVLITVASSVSINGSLAGAAAHPEWLALQFLSGGLTLNSNVTMYGYVLAPNGTITINGQSVLAGGLISDRLTVNGNGTLRVIAPVANQPPTVSLTAPVNGAQFIAPAALVLAASANDSDGTVAKVEFYQGATKLGEAPVAPFQFALTGLTSGTYAFKARAIDNSNAATDSAVVSITVGVNQPPTVSLTAPGNGVTLIAPATVTLAATASDSDGTIAKVEFYQGATKLGEDSAAPYQFSVPALAVGSYTFTARATDNGNASADSATVTIGVVSPPNQPPVVALTTPAAGASFFAPATINLTATASDPDGMIAQVEFFQGAANLGATTVSPYKFSVSSVAAGSYVFKARATDNFGAATDSTPINVSVIGVNQPPTVTLTFPASGTTYNAPATIPLAASANDPDGSVAKVEFFQGTTKLGEAVVAPFAFTWTGMLPGSYALSAKATDNQGATAVSPASAVTVQATIPFTANFADAEGYVLGPLDGQGGWAVVGSADYSAADHFTGTRAVVVAATTPATQVSHSFPNGMGHSLVFIDFYAKLVAGADATTASRVQGDGATVALVQTGSQAEVQVLNGNGAGGGAWQPTGLKVSISTNGQAIDWLRFTLREDFAAMKWDLYATGRLIAANLGFTDNSVTAFSKVTFTGSATTPVLLDDFFVAFDNPLFADVDNDGMDDAWEIANGLNSTLNDRDGDKDGDGLTNIREYLLGLRADKASTYDDGIPDGLRVSLGLSLTGPTIDATPPSAPTNVLATAAALNVALTWTASSDNIGVAGYFICRAGQSLNATAIQTTAFADVVPSAGTSYSYEVKAVDFAGNRSLSASVQVNIPAPDTDGNGLPDAWEIANFGHLGTDPQADADGDGLTNLQEFQRGTNPHSADTDGDGVSDGVEVSLGMNPLVTDASTLPTKLTGLRILLQADVGVTSDANGKVNAWQDQSGRENSAVQSSSGGQPTLVANVTNGRPTLRFSGANYFPLPNFMSGANAGEVFLVTSASYAVTAQWRGIWRMGQNDYPHFPITDNAIRVEDDWGSTTMHPIGTPSQPLNQFNFINVSSAANQWVYRLDGAVLNQTSTNTVFFRTDPLLGKNSGDFFLGDISELIVYDRILSAQERETIGTYLTRKYAFAAIPAPTTPSSLAAATISPTQVNLTWNGTSGANGTIYTIERKGTGGFTAIGEVTDGQSHFDTGLTAGTTYNYRVRARTLAGSSANSNVATVSTPAVGVDIPTASIREWLRADAGITTGASNAVSGWSDQSGRGNNTTQSNSSNQPTYVANVVNGRPVLRFNGSSYFPLPNFMSGASAGEVFVMVRASYAQSAQWRGLWRMGSNDYPHFPIANYAINVEEDWGSTTMHALGNPARALDQFNIYSVSSSSTQWIARLNGLTLNQSSTNSVFFRSDPLLGKNTNDFFLGDIAEFISFDQVLTAAERGSVVDYLAQKYAVTVAPPATPTNLVASVNAGGQVSLAWAAGSSGSASYTVERKSGSGAFAILADLPVAAAFVDGSVALNATYTYRVRAHNFLGNSGYTAEVSITTPSTVPLVITTDDADSDGIRDLEESVLGSSPSTPAAPDSAGNLKLRIYQPRP